MSAARRIFTRVVIEIATGKVLEAEGYDYSGPVAEAKKGREAQAQATQDQLKLAQGDQATRQSQLAAADPTLKQFESVGPGGMGTAAQARYASDLANIGKVYGNARQIGERSLAQRGLGNAPTGAQSSLENTANMQQAGAENQAYLGGLEQTRQDQLAALNARMGLINSYNPNQAYQGASESAYRQSQMGSTLGDIGSGLATLAGGAGAAMSGLGAIGLRRGGGGGGNV